MSERKAKMIELGDAFIAFPGGTGTLEEITEVMSKVSLKHLDAPCILYNLNGYYDSLKQLLEHMIEMDLSSRKKRRNIFLQRSGKKIQKCLLNRGDVMKENKNRMIDRQISKNDKMKKGTK